MKSVYSYLIIAVIGFTAIMSSCKKFLVVDNPIDQLTTNVVFKDSTSASSAVSGFYTGIMGSLTGFLNGRITINAGLSSDEIIQATAGSSPNQFETNNILTTNPDNLSGWTDAYKYLYHCNSVIENLQKSSTLSSSLKARLTAEMKGMRAMLFFYLVNLYGDVPLAITTDYRINSVMPRTGTSLVLGQILADLKEAQAYYNNVNAANDNSRMNKWAVAALLSRFYLYQKDWANASAQASTVISSGQFSLPALQGVFKNNSREIILQFMPQINSPYNAGEGINFIPYAPTDLPTYALRTELLAAFETGDLRKTIWLGKNTYSGKDYYYPYKYKVRQEQDYTLKTEYQVALRLAELYLNRAEANCQLGNLPDAISDLDKVRIRAGLLPLAQTDPSISQTDLLRRIYHERQIEFFAEWGHRWFDLKRTGRANAVLALVKGSNWQPTDQWYPIPESEILANPKLIQNEGY